MSEDRIVFLLVVLVIAHYKNRNMLVWGVLCFFVWWLVFLLAVLPRVYYYRDRW